MRDRRRERHFRRGRAVGSAPVKRPGSKHISLVAVLLMIGAAVAISFAAASEGASSVRASAAGAGQVRLGQTYASLRAAKLLGKIGPGCPLAGPNTRSAPLVLPLQGGADLSASSPRRVTGLTIFGGAKARGIGSGATLGRVRAAFPRVVLDHSGDKTLGITLARVPRAGGGPLQFAISTKTHKVTLIGVPRVAICE
jgi:hypothetical protein